ncbi:MAG: 50S ribosomal protein L3 N(5)-glutamine methyltransferase [Pseudomonadota bacterium]|nr:50S ribosomal protein L3 N(5)-glutamine methyltransferase [Pseudomonadota bacterium]
MNRRARPERPGRLTLDKVETARDLVLWAEARFEGAGLSYGHGTTSAREEAVFLVFHALALPFDVPDVVLDQPLMPEAKSRALQLIRERIGTRKPAAYVLGESWFAGLEFYVDERVLVPRSPIAELIEARFSPWIEDPRRILDIGTGSGCIAIACALAFPEAEVDATDISAGALEIARRNTERHGVRDRVRLLRSDVYESLACERYDLIVSNPPYVPALHLGTLPPEHRYEPSLGLNGGHDGLAVVSRILEGATEHLTELGTLVVEAGESATALETRYPRVPFVWLENERGGEGVFLLEAQELRRWCPERSVTR